MSVRSYYQRKVTARRIHESNEQAERERKIRDVKDLLNIPYHGKGDE